MQGIDLFKPAGPVLRTADLYYIGKDGKNYDSFQALKEADRAYISETMPFIGADGKHYGSLQVLNEANRAFGESLRQTGRVESF